MDHLDQSYVSKKSPEKQSPTTKKMKNTQKTVEMDSKRQSSTRPSHSVIDNSSTISTNAFIRTTLEKDGNKRDSDAFVIDSLKQNQRKERLEEYNIKLKTLQKEQDTVSEEMKLIEEKKKNNPYNKKILKSNKNNANIKKSDQEDSNPFIIAKQ